MGGHRCQIVCVFVMVMTGMVMFAGCASLAAARFAMPQIAFATEWIAQTFDRHVVTPCFVYAARQATPIFGVITATGVPDLCSAKNSRERLDFGPKQAQSQTIRNFVIYDIS
jgi:uncharacterized membrane protein YkvI|tara:strand:- start:1095 stop:1430 length:336 start_codon:yes stop_codon:yes gene_type:complete